MYEIKGQTISMIAAEDIAIADKFKPVYVSGDNQIKIATGDEKVIGYVQTEGKAGEAVPVCISGVTMYVAEKIYAAGAVVVGGGIALAGATAVGDIIPVKIV